MVKRTYQPKKISRIRDLGFLAKNSTTGGKKVIKRRKAKGRTRITASDEIRDEKRKRFRRLR
jgi:large subunit ribosomal protein L34